MSTQPYILFQSSIAFFLLGRVFLSALRRISITFVLMISPLFKDPKKSKLPQVSIGTKKSSRSLPVVGNVKLVF